MTMLRMRLDHRSSAAGPDGLAGTAERHGALLGEEFESGVAVEAGEYEVLADELSVNLKAGLSAPLEAVYPQLARGDLR